MYQNNALRKITSSVSFERSMESDDKPRSIRFPQWLWDEIDRDAQDARRSAVKQMEVVLSTYYRGEQPNVDAGRLNAIKANYDLDKQLISTIPKASDERKPRKVKQK